MTESPSSFVAKRSSPAGRVTWPLLLAILLVGLTLRVWNINFDSGLGTHPDERSTACFYAPTMRLPARGWIAG